MLAKLGPRGKARDLLRNSNLRISEIAFAVGFQSLSQFNRVFKKRWKIAYTVSGRKPKKKEQAKNVQEGNPHYRPMRFSKKIVIGSPVRWASAPPRKIQSTMLFSSA